MYVSGHENKYEAEGHPGPALNSMYQSSNLNQPGPPFISPSLHVPGAPGRWSSGLCHCCNDPVNCVITCFCPCITFGQISEIVNRGSTTCATTGTLYGLACLTGYACLYSCFYRSKMRGQYDLAESPCVDCLVHFFCECCALCQEYRELVNRGYDMGIGWEANLDRQRRGVTIAPVIETHMSR